MDNASRALGILVLTAGFSVANGADVFYPKGVDREHVVRANELKSTLGLDEELNSFEDALLDGELDALARSYSDHEYVAWTGLFLTWQALEAEILPRSFIDEVVLPSCARLKTIRRRRNLDSKLSDGVQKLAARVIWLDGIQQMSEPLRLRRALDLLEEDRVPDSYYLVRAVELIRKTRSSESESLLARLAYEGGASDEARSAALVALRKNRVLDEIGAGEPRAAVRAVVLGILDAERLSESRELIRDRARREAERRFSVWAVRRLADMNREHTKEALFELARHPETTYRIKLMAQRVLFKNREIDDPYEIIAPSARGRFD